MELVYGAHTIGPWQIIWLHEASKSHRLVCLMVRSCCTGAGAGWEFEEARSACSVLGCKGRQRARAHGAEPANVRSSRVRGGSVSPSAGECEFGAPQALQPELEELMIGLSSFSRPRFRWLHHLE